MAQYLSQWVRSHVASMVVWAGLAKELSSSQNTPVLIIPPLLPVWLTNLYFLPGQSMFI